MTGVLHTARINAIEVIVSSDKLIKMVNLGSIPVGDSNFFSVPRSCHVD